MAEAAKCVTVPTEVQYQLTLTKDEIEVIGALIGHVSSPDVRMLPVYNAILEAGVTIGNVEVEPLAPGCRTIVVRKRER